MHRYRPTVMKMYFLLDASWQQSFFRETMGVHECTVTAKDCRSDINKTKVRGETVCSFAVHFGHACQNARQLKESTQRSQEIDIAAVLNFLSTAAREILTNITTINWREEGSQSVVARRIHTIYIDFFKFCRLRRSLLCHELKLPPPNANWSSHFFFWRDFQRACGKNCGISSRLVRPSWSAERNRMWTCETRIVSPG